jgi:CRP-like cAMP-binding protein
MSGPCSCHRDRLVASGDVSFRTDALRRERSLAASQPGVAIRNALNSPPTNRILAALPPKAQRRVLSALARVELPLGRVLYQSGTTSRQVYFPNDCVVSLVAVADRGGGLEVGLVGAEGMIGIPLALGVSTSPVTAMVQGAGSALCMSAARFGRELKRNPPLRRELDRCAYVAMATAMQVAVCNKEHLLQARLARWLLMTRDRVGSDEFRFTQQFIALMLGVRRTGVTVAAGELQRRNLIRYSRGRVQILDSKRLRAASCSCYDVIRKLDTTR